MTIVDRRYSVAEGTAVKAPCRAATTANITLSGEQTVDGIAIVEGDRVLVKNQTTGSENGIYDASTGNWTRARDFDGAFDIVTGTRVFVTAGTANGGAEFVVSTTGTITIDTTSIAFTSIIATANASAAAAAASATAASSSQTGAAASATASSASQTAAAASAAAAAASAAAAPPQGYLTLTSGTPIIASDVTAATAVYYTPYVGNLVPIYNGSSFNSITFTELTLSLVASHAASNIYDVFVFNNSGVPTVVTGPSWSAGTGGSITAGSCARGTGAGGAALSRINGILTNAVQITGRNGATTYTINANLATYVGSLFMDGTNGQITCHRSYGQSRKWGVWNAYNRKKTYLKAGDSTASWSYGTSTIRQSRATAGNTLATFTGLAEDVLQVKFVQRFQHNANTAASIGIGLSVTNAYTGQQGSSVAGNITNMGDDMMFAAEYFSAPLLGLNNFNSCEAASAATTFYGTETNMVLSAVYDA